MKWVKSLALVLVLAVSSYSYADTSTSDVDGSGLFIGLSPLVAIASTLEQHDAFEKITSTLVVKPAKYTFVRPVGDYDYNGGL